MALVVLAERGERCRLKQTDDQHRPKSIDYEVEKRGACGQNGADGKFYSKGLQTIRYTPRNGTTHQSQCGRRTEHKPKFFGLEPAARKKSRQERRGTSERTEKCGVEQHKSKQYAAFKGHGSAGSRLALGPAAWTANS